MSQGDYLIQNQSFPSFRSDLNSTLEAINTSNSGTSRPTSAVAGTVWLDTTNATNPTLKFFDGTDDISLAQLDYSANTVNWLDSTVTISPLTTDLDVGGNSIISSSNGNITFTPDGTGKVIIDGLSYPTADGTSGQNIITDGAGNLSFSNVIPADNTVSLAKLTATGTKDATTFLRGDNTFAEAGGGIEMAQMWRINASTTATSTLTDLTANWEIADTAPTGTLGTGLTESSGIFSFPSTGYYWIGCTVGFRSNNGTRNASIQLKATTNNSSYTSVAISECNNSDFGGASNTSMSAFTQYMFDITDIANQKFKLSVAADQNQTVDGSTSSQYTGFQIIRLGDT